MFDCHLAVEHAFILYFHFWGKPHSDFARDLELNQLKLRHLAFYAKN